MSVRVRERDVKIDMHVYMYIRTLLVLPTLYPVIPASSLAAATTTTTTATSISTFFVTESQGELRPEEEEEGRG